jgi:hypothetical protein
MYQSPRALRIAGLGAIVFGVLTVIAGGAVLFGPASIRASAGNVIELVLQFNFAAGFAYVVCGAGTVRSARWAPHLALVIAAASSAVLVALGWHVAHSSAYEPRTLLAMTFRASFWVAFATWAEITRPTRVPNG